MRGVSRGGGNRQKCFIKCFIKGEFTFIKGGWIFREVKKQEGGEKERSKIVAAIRDAKARRRREIQIHIQ